MNVLTVNAGSSSLKLSLIDSHDETLATHTVERWESGATSEIGSFVEGLDRVDSVAHRVVHGGDRFTRAVVIDNEIVAAIDGLSDLAPLHQKRCLAGIEATRKVLGAATEVACFDTAFHTTLPLEARTYALPRDWRERWPIRRFGFHGLSHAYASHQGAEVAGMAGTDPRTVVCHLGSGASVCAVAGGLSTDTTMGFTPLEGVVMGTRSGSVDPGLLMWLIERAGLSPAEVSDGLEHHSGLAGLCGRTDMRDVISGAGAGDARCGLALDVYIHRLVQGIASMAASIGGMDLLVFTGGIGEHAPLIRARTAAALGFIGARLDRIVNEEASGDTDISEGQADVRTVVVTARENLQMAREARQVLATASRD